MSIDYERVIVVKAPLFYGRNFWREVFEAAKEAGVQVVVVKGSVRIQNVSGGGAAIYNIGRLFGFAGSAIDHDPPKRIP